MKGLNVARISAKCARRQNDVTFTSRLASFESGVTRARSTATSRPAACLAYVRRFVFSDRVAQQWTCPRCHRSVTVLRKTGVNFRATSDRDRNTLRPLPRARRILAYRTGNREMRNVHLFSFFLSLISIIRVILFCSKQTF